MWHYNISFTRKKIKITISSFTDDSIGEWYNKYISLYFVNNSCLTSEHSYVRQHYSYASSTATGQSSPIPITTTMKMRIIFANWYNFSASLLISCRWLAKRPNGGDPSRTRTSLAEGWRNWPIRHRRHARFAEGRRRRGTGCWRSRSPFPAKHEIVKGCATRD